MDKLKIPTLIKHSDFYNEDKYNRIQGIIDYVNALRNALYNQEELDQIIPQAQQVYFVDYYLSQVENGGLTQYFSNSNFNGEQNNIVLKGLEDIKAYKNKEIFFQACQLLNNMDASLREEYLFSGIYWEEEVRLKPIIKEIHIELEKLTDLFFEINEKEEPILDLNFKYVEKIDNLKIIDDKLYDKEIEAIVALVPNYDERKKYSEEQWLKNMPRCTKIARKLCSKYNLELLSINALSYGEGLISEEKVKENYNNNIMFYHISTDQGYFYIIDFCKTSVLINGEDNQPIGKINNLEINFDQSNIDINSFEIEKSTNIFKTPKWSIQLEENWESEISEDCYSFFNPEGYGALQISSYTKDTSITNEDIIDLIEFSDDDKLHLGMVKFGDFDGLTLVYKKEEKTLWRFWRNFWLRNNKLLLFVTYNCDDKDKDYETDTINKMLSSLKVITK